MPKKSIKSWALAPAALILRCELVFLKDALVRGSLGIALPRPAKNCPKLKANCNPVLHNGWPLPSGLAESHSADRARWCPITNRFFQLLLLALLFCLPSGAQIPNQKPSQPVTTSKSALTYSLPPDKLEKSKALYILDLEFYALAPLYSWLILLVVLYRGIAAKYRDWAESLSRRRFVQAMIFVPLFLITLTLARLPIRMYGQHAYSQYGISIQGWASWFADYGKNLVIDVVILTVLLWLLQMMIRKSPRRWWFYSWLISLPIMAFLVFSWPIAVEPLFNKFEPLSNTHPQLVEAIEQVVQRAGLAIPRDRIYEMKASEKVTVPNAYVTGFGASKRVVVWDTAIQNETTPELLSVFGHEMGHYVLQHILKGLAASAIGLLVGLYILFRVARWTVARFGPRWRIGELHDWAALPMLFLIAGIMGFLAEPINNAASRYIEHQADIYGLEVTHGIVADSGQIAAQSFQVEGELSLDYPYPSRLAVFWFWNHPPIADRLRFALEYDPWKDSEPKYVK